MSAEEINRTLEAEAPAIYQCLSPLGRRAFYPKDIPFQAAEAKNASINATIGVFTDGRGNAVPLPALQASLNLDGDDRNQAFLYSPVSGLKELRERWRAWQRVELAGQSRGGAVPSSLPFVTDGLAHGLSIVADLFGGLGRHVAVATPFWGNYRQGFAVRTGAEIREAPGYRDGRFNVHALAEALDGAPAGEPAIGLLNFPSNPGGYSPTVEERRELKKVLLGIADRRPFVIVVDDAYAGLAYEPSSPQSSFFWDLAGEHPRLIPVKIDGATKEFNFFGGRVGFVTFGLEPQSIAAEILENKLSSLLRSTVGSPVATSQVLLLKALRSGGVREEIEAVRKMARERYTAIKPLLAKLDRRYLRPLPFNAGFFALIELPKELGLTAEQVRRHLLDQHDTGIVALGGRYLRLAICSVTDDDIPELVARLEAGVLELVQQSEDEV